MKKIYTIITLLTVALAVNAQRASIAGAPLQPLQNNNAMSVQIVTDTLVADADWTQPPTLYSASGGGFVVGNNGYGDLQKVQIFRPGQPCVVEGAIYWFGAKQVGANGNVVMRVYNLDGSGTSTLGPTTCPGSFSVSDNVSIANCDTAAMYVHTFSTPQFVAGDFGVGFSLANLGAGDTIGLVSTEDPNSNTEDSWEEWSDNTWHTMLEPNNWNLNIALAIFPLVDMTVGVATPYINGVKMGFAGANPTADNTVLSYGLTKNAASVVISIVDAQGRIISTEKVGSKVAGDYTFAINSANFAAGTYYVQLQADNSRLAVKMVKK